MDFRKFFRDDPEAPGSKIEVKVSHEMKVIILGEQTVGKSSLISQYCQGMLKDKICFLEHTTESAISLEARVLIYV